MAISRSIGASWLTTVLPINISPDVMDSSPASMRNVVVLPQPEGPTSTRNSLSRISRLTSFTACTSSYILLRLRMTTWAIASALHRAGQTGDVMLDKERIDQRDRDRAEQRACHQRAPEEHVTADQLRRDADGHSLFGRRG